MIGSIYRSKVLFGPRKIVQWMSFIIQLRLIVNCYKSFVLYNFLKVICARLCLGFMKTLKHVIGNRYSSFKIWYGDFWGSLIFEISHFTRIFITRNFKFDISEENDTKNRVNQTTLLTFLIWTKKFHKEGISSKFIGWISLINRKKLLDNLQIYHLWDRIRVSNRILLLSASL